MWIGKKGFYFAQRLFCDKTQKKAQGSYMLAVMALGRADGSMWFQDKDPGTGSR